MSKVILIQAYFGKLPNFFDFWLSSAQNNSNFDFLIFTDDQDNKLSLPPNVRIIYTTLDEVSSLISRKMNLRVKIIDPYKLCDFKPFYGVLFDEYTKDYSHWGYFDFDMYFGDLEAFIPESLLNEWDKIGVYGHLTVLRNSKQLTEYIIDEKHWPYTFKEALESKKLFNMDEAGGLNIVFDSSPFKQTSIVLSDINYMTPDWTDFRFTDPYQVFFIKNNRVYVLRSDFKKETILLEEVAYIHYQKRKLNFDKVDVNLPFYFSMSEVKNFDGTEEKSILFNKKFSSMYFKYHKLKNATRKMISYALGTSPYSLKMKKIQMEMDKKLKRDSPINIIKRETTQQE